MTVCAGLVKHHQIRNYFLDFCTAWVDIEDQGLPSSGWCGVRDRTVGQAPVYVCLCFFLGRRKARVAVSRVMIHPRCRVGCMPAPGCSRWQNAANVVQCGTRKIALVLAPLHLMHHCSSPCCHLAWSCHSHIAVACCVWPPRVWILPPLSLVATVAGAIPPVGCHERLVSAPGATLAPIADCVAI